MIIDEHKVSKTDLCDRLGVNRSQLYRYLSHKSIMPKETIERFKRELMLSPLETSTLESAYEALQVGIDRYRCRLLVDEMMNGSQVTEGFLNRPYILDQEYITSVTSKPISVISGNEYIKMVTQFVFSTIGQTDEIEKIFLTIQPDDNFVMNELSTLLRNRQSAYSVYHTFKLYRNEALNFATPLATNLSLLKKILSVISVDIKMCYHAAYYYEQHMSNNPTLFFDSTRIVTKDFALLILQNFEQAVLITEPEMIALYFTQLSHLYDRSLPFTQVVDLTKKSSEAYLKKANLHGEANIFPEPIFFFTRAPIFTLNKQETPDSFDDSILKVIRAKSIKSIQNGKLVYCYFSRDGLHDFTNSGLFSDINEQLMKPLSKEQIREYLGEILDFSIRYDNVVPLILESAAMAIVKNAFIRIYDNTEIWLTFKENGPKALISLSEISIVKAFSDYFFNVLPQRLMPGSKKDAIQAIQAAIDSLSS